MLNLMIKKIKHHRKIIIILTALVIFAGIGIGIHHFIQEYPWFYVHLTFLNCILVLALYALKEMNNFFNVVYSVPILDSTLIGIKENYIKKMNSIWRWFIASAFVIIYFFCIFLLDYIDFDLMGLYAFVLGGSALFFSMVGYYRFVVLLFFLNKIQKHSADSKECPYELYAPATTAWLVKLTEELHKFRTIFLCLGFFFVTEYAILARDSSVQFTPNFKLNVISPPAFLVTWAGILILIVLAFPIFSSFIKKGIKKIVENLKKKTLEELNTLLKQHVLNNDESKILAYTTLMNRVDKSPEYPLSASTPKNAIYIPLLTIMMHLSKIASGVDWKKLL